MKKIPLIVVVSLLGAMSAADAAYPEKPVRIIVPSPPGGGIDTMGRLLAHKLTESLAKQVVVENRGGAGGNIGTEIAARSARDGYTLLMAGSQLVANPSLYGKVGFDPVQDFDPISLLALAPNVLVVHPSLPVQSVRELIALAKNKPDAVGFAGAGPGSTPHLAGELFNMMAGVKMVHVPYRGTGPALTGILAGEASVMFMTATAAAPLVRAKRLRGIAVTSSSRLPALPELPTIADSGLRGYQSNQWYGLLAPAGTPDQVLMLLNTQSVRFVHNPDTHQRLINEGAIPVGSTREQFASHIKTEIVKWAQVIKQSGARAD